MCRPPELGSETSDPTTAGEGEEGRGGAAVGC